jgi:lysine/ornithine N-monooxygenase
MKSSMKPTVIVGAGPYGISAAAHLEAREVPVRIFGEVMGSWRTRMPAGMCLKSTPWMSSLSAPRPGLTLSDFENAHGLPQLSGNEIVPVEQFIQYGDWFAGQLGSPVENDRVARVDRRGAGFLVQLSTGEQIEAGSVVVASGLAGFARVPAGLAAVSPEGPSRDGLISHSSQHHQLARFSGQRIAVIGAGQSALESAALLHESGAQVELIARRPVRFGELPHLDQEHRGLLTSPRTPLGPAWGLYPFSHWAGAFRFLPARTRRHLVRQVLGPLGAWWLKDRVVGQFPIHDGYHLEAVQRVGDLAILELATAGGHRIKVRADHVIAATGYQPRVDGIGFLSPELKDRLATPGGSPRLTGQFESAVPGLFVVSLAAAQTFGPLMRFVAGAGFAARRVSAAVAGG